MDHGDRLAQFGIAADPVLFDARQSFFIAFERGFDRRKQGLELGLAFFMGLGETLVGASKELGLGGFEQAAANFAELGGQLVLGVLERGDLLFKGASARLNVGLKRSEVAQRDFAFGLDGLQPIGSDGLDLVQSLGSGDVRLFMPGDLRCGLGDAFLLHRQFRDGGVALDSRGFQPGGKVRPFGSEGRGGAGAENPANDKADKKRKDKEKSGQTVHEGSF